MADENQRFIEEMLKKAKENKETKPQTRTEGVDHKEIEDMTDEIQGFKKKKGGH